MQEQRLASYIDHTLLAADTTSQQIQKLCQEARTHQFFGVCVNSRFVELACKELKDSAAKVICTAGFPLGATHTLAKAFEAENCVSLGAHEIDMILSIGGLREKDYAFVRKDIETVVSAASGALVKVIIETSLLGLEEKKVACSLSVEAGAHFIKTSSGFAGGGATVADIQLIRSIVGSNVGVKASGGIKTAEQAWDLIRAGADRIGTSSGVDLCLGNKAKGGY